MTATFMDRLEEIAGRHRQSEGFTPRLIGCRAKILAELLPPGDVLDLGCADGLLTAHLAKRHRRVVAVDASETRLQRAAENTAAFDNIEFRQALFEEFTPRDGERFDAAVLSCVLEHLPRPQELLKLASGWLRPGGSLAAIVPHAASLHRRAGVRMGLLEQITDSGEADDELDHERVYTLPRLIADFEQAGLRVADSGGYLIKPLPNGDMVQLDEQLVEAYFELGREFPELAAEIFVLGRTA